MPHNIMKIQNIKLNIYTGVKRPSLRANDAQRGRLTRLVASSVEGVRTVRILHVDRRSIHRSRDNWATAIRQTHIPTRREWPGAEDHTRTTTTDCSNRVIGRIIVDTSKINGIDRSFRSTVKNDVRRTTDIKCLRYTCRHDNRTIRGNAAASRCTSSDSRICQRYSRENKNGDREQAYEFFHFASLINFLITALLEPFLASLLTFRLSAGDTHAISRTNLSSIQHMVTDNLARIYRTITMVSTPNTAPVLITPIYG